MNEPSKSASQTKQAAIPRHYEHSLERNSDWTVNVSIGLQIANGILAQTSDEHGQIISVSYFNDFL